MLGSTSEFWYIRSVCRACGWFRHIGRCGTNGVTRSTVLLKRAKSPGNFIEASVLEIPADIPIPEIEEKCGGFTDLSVTWSGRHPDRAEAAKSECRQLVEGLPCPRCKREGDLVIEIWQYWRGGIVSIDSRARPLS